VTMTGEEWLLAIVSALIGAAALRFFQWILMPRGSAVDKDQLRELRHRLGDPLSTQSHVTIRRDLLVALVHDARR
jgi:hypothetical protein